LGRHSVGARPDSSEIIPLVHRLYSQNAGDFVSENHELLDVIRKVYRATRVGGIRGGSRR